MRCLGRTDCKLGGKHVDKKNVLDERLAFRLTEVVEAGRGASLQGEDQELSEANDDDEPCARKRLQKRTLPPEMREIGEMPPDAVVTP